MLDRILTDIRAALAAGFARDDARSPLLCVAIERLDHERAVQFIFHPVRGPALRITVPDERGIRVLSPMILIQLYRQEFHRAFECWEAYTPRPGYRYSERLRRVDLYGPTTAIDAAMEMRITYDPCQAEDWDGIQLADDMRYLDAVLPGFRHMTSRHADEILRAHLIQRQSFSITTPQEAHIEERYRGHTNYQNIPSAYQQMMTDPRYVYGQRYQDMRVQNAYQSQMSLQARARPPSAEEMMAQLQAYQYQYGWDTTGSPHQRTEAEVRGWQLLKDNLSPEQLAKLNSSSYFEVTGGETGLRYHIRTGRTFNVDIIGRAGQRGATICFVPEGGLCTGDVMLTQKLALELREMEALKTCNHDNIDGSRWLDRELTALGMKKPPRTTIPRPNAYNTLLSMIWG